MIAIKGMESQTDCKKCPFMATDGKDTLLSPMMCVALWATKHEVKHCIQGKILNDCPLIELVTCKNCKHRPIDDHGSIEPPYDMENGRLDETCPCINKSDWHYSYVPEDEFFCAYVEKKPVTPVHKKSKWIFTKTVLDKYGCIVECPSCHKKWITYDEIRFEKETKYCPNCGEKMEDGKMTREEVNTIDIPKNTTNGDMIKAMFPDAEIKEIRGTFEGNLLGYRTWLGGRSQDFLLDWWNEPFKRG